MTTDYRDALAHVDRYCAITVDREHVEPYRRAAADSRYQALGLLRARANGVDRDARLRDLVRGLGPDAGPNRG